MSRYLSVVLAAALFAGGLMTDAHAGPLLDARAKATELRAAAIQDYQAGELASAMGKFKEALEFRPDYPPFIFNIAFLSAASGELDQTKEYLGRYAAMGLTAAVGDGFSALADDPEFQEIAAKLEANGQSIVGSEVAFTLDRKTGLTEGIAYNPKRDEFYLSSISEGSIYRVDREGHAAVLLEPRDHMGWGMMGLQYDPGSGALWTTTSSLPQARHAPTNSHGSSGIMKVVMKSGAIAALSFEEMQVEGQHTFGDLRLVSDGSLYATDSLSPQIRLAPAGDFEAARSLDADDFASVQGFDFTPDGEALIVADYALGLLRVPLEGEDVVRLPAPPNVALRTIDGLYRYKNGLIAIQNGTNPKRVIYVRMADDWRSVIGVEVLEQVHPAYDEPTLGVINGDDFYYIANSGWPLFGDGIPSDSVLAEKLRPVTVLKLNLSQID